jgi:hypothetical protein
MSGAKTNDEPIHSSSGSYGLINLEMPTRLIAISRHQDPRGPGWPAPRPGWPDHLSQVAAKMVFQTGADDLLAVVEVFRPDETYDAVYQERIEGPRHGIGPGFAGLLVHPMVGVRGQGAALAGLEGLTPPVRVTHVALEFCTACFKAGPMGKVSTMPWIWLESTDLCKPSYPGKQDFENRPLARFA